MTQPAKHTPGPWHIGMKPGPMVYGPQGEQVVPLNLMLDMPEVAANAHLIAAAPAMYAALLLVLDDFGGDYKGPTIDAVRAALAQADGKQKVS